MNKKVMNKLFANVGIVNQDKILKKIEKYDIISFDIFDTLLKRNINKPSDVFDILEYIHRNDAQYADFSKMRRKAEKIARKEVDGEEINITDIYDYYSKKLSKNAKKKFIENELEIEESLIVPNLDIISIYNKCVEKGKQIFIISDTYYPYNFVEKILASNEIKKYKKLYLSSVFKKKKQSGELYKIVKDELCSQSDDFKILHIGDSIESDIIQANKNGIQTLKIPRYVVRTKTLRKRLNYNLGMSYLYNFINNKLERQLSNYGEFGYSCFGPFLWGYIKWLKLQFDNNNVKKVFFFSRDGFIMKQAFELLFANSDITCEYLEVSRRSLRVPILHKDLALHKVLELSSVTKNMYIKSFFESVGLEVEEYIALLSKYGYDSNTVFEREKILSDKKFNDLYENIRSDIEMNSKKEYELLAKYLNQQGVEGKFAVVDIGWAGGMQYCLEQVLDSLGIEHDVIGCYMGIREQYKRYLNLNSRLNLNGYLFDMYHNKDDFDKRGAFVGLFEMLTLEPNGSVKSYLDEIDRISAVRCEYEYLHKGNDTHQMQYIQDIQYGAMKFLGDAYHDKILNEFNYTSDELFCNLGMAGGNPSNYIVKMFSGFDFYDEGITKKLAEPQSYIYYLLHPNQLKRDFLDSSWKAGFMKKMLIIPLPYNKLYRFLLRYK